MKWPLLLGSALSLFAASGPSLAQPASPPPPANQPPAPDADEEVQPAGSETLAPKVAQPRPLQAAPVVRRSDENVVTQAEDAFGTSIGRETIGLYSVSSVRGFSPFAAGNTRIDGLYFDPVWQPNQRIRRSSTIRVGLSAQGFAFPAPTGIVDYALRRPGSEPSASTFLSGDTYGNAVVEVDAELPVTATLGLAGGFSLLNNRFYNGTGGRQHIEGVTALWRPSPAIEVQSFWGRSDIYDDEFGPTYIPAGPYLPPLVPRERFLGPRAPLYRSTAVIYGALGRYDFAENWQLRAIGVRTFFENELTASNLLIGVRPDRSVDRQLFIVDPPTKLQSTSGELRLTRRIEDGPRLHLVHLNLRGRERSSRYGGADVIDLGPTNIDAPVAPRSPPARAVAAITANRYFRPRGEPAARILPSLGSNSFSSAIVSSHERRDATTEFKVRSSSWPSSLGACGSFFDPLARRRVERVRLSHFINSRLSRLSRTSRRRERPRRCHKEASAVRRA